MHQVDRKSVKDRKDLDNIINQLTKLTYKAPHSTRAECIFFSGEIEH